MVIAEKLEKGRNLKYDGKNGKYKGYTAGKGLFLRVIDTVAEMKPERLIIGIV